nr:uncharacterized protein LOC109189671 [Ipomoea batatas]
MATSVDDALANLTFVDLEEGEENQRHERLHVDVKEVADEFYVVGRSIRGMNVRELQPHRYLFQFFLEKDVQRIIDDRPWSYEQSVLILKRITLRKDLEAVSLNLAEFWVQLHGLPAGFRSESVLQAIGNFIGVLVKIDERNFDGSIRQFFRIKIVVDVLKPLKKGICLKKDSGKWFTVDFNYERLPTSCFVCGVLDHAEKFFPEDVSPGVKPYSAELRAGNRRGTPTVGLRWIAPEKMSPTENNAAANHAGTSTSSTCNAATSEGVRVAVDNSARRRESYVSSLVVAFNDLKPENEGLSLRPFNGPGSTHVRSERHRSWPKGNRHLWELNPGSPEIPPHKESSLAT